MCDRPYHWCKRGYANRRFDFYGCCESDLPSNIPAEASVVELAWNAYTTIPANSFSHLSQCIRLGLCCHQIVTVEVGAFNGLVSLEHLHLGINNISVLHLGVFEGLWSLEKLWLHSNKMVSLDPEVLMNLPRPLQLGMSYPSNFEDNQWDCSTLCWLKNEEQHGTVTWPNEMNIMRPICSDSPWDGLQCPQRGDLF